MRPRLPRPFEFQRIDERAWLIARRGRAFRQPRTGPPGPGHRVVRIGPDHLGTTLVYDPGAARRRPGAFERSLSNFVARQHIAWVLRELGVNCVLDVGANVGQYAQSLRRQGYRGRIVSFEPLPHLVAQLQYAAVADPGWRVRDHALGDDQGTAEINVVPGTMSSLLPASDFGRNWSERLRTQSKQETIRIRRLEDVWDEVTEGLADPRVFLKLDTQGFDLEAFRGAGKRTGELLGLQSEVACVPIYDGMPRMAEQIALYEAAGFETTGMFQVSRDKPTMRVIEFDLVMIGPRALAERS